MELIVIGGHTRNIGKTSVAVGLIHHLRNLDWTAVKITQYGHGVCSRDGKPCDCAPTGHPFALDEEKGLDGRSDTSRFLAAGAKRSLWLRVRQGQLGRAIPALQQALDGSEHVLIESNSIMAFVRPLAYVVVLDGTRKDFKESARKFLESADAFVPVSHPMKPQPWHGVELRKFDRRPVFPVRPLDYFNEELCRFVQSRLG